MIREPPGSLNNGHRTWIKVTEAAKGGGLFYFSWSRLADFLCHAGVRPGVPLDRQRTDDLLWIRNPFLNSHLDFGKIVVHGHSPVEEPESLPNRINIDTGAFITGAIDLRSAGGRQPPVYKLVTGIHRTLNRA